MMNEAEPIEIEEFAKRGEKVPPGKTYIIRVNKEKFTVPQTLTGRKILELVNEKPETHKLYEHVRGSQPQEVGADEVEDFAEKGVERYSTLPKDTTEGVCA
jgi:hypothetical protein